jgi:predicted RNA binding protein YcfA (HicA-like mRNA interferase family)
MRLPTLNSKQVIKVLKRAGFQDVRQTGSHLIFINKEIHKIIPIPIHSKGALKRNLLFSIIKQSGLTVEEFRKLL